MLQVRRRSWTPTKLARKVHLFHICGSRQIMMLPLVLAAARPVLPLHGRSPNVAMLSPDQVVDQVLAAPPAVQLGAAFTAVGFAAASRPRRTISFANLDEERAIRYLRSFPTQAFNLWGPVEWRRCGCKDRMEFGTEILPKGVRMLYYLTPAEARSRSLAGLQEDGGFVLEVKGNSIVGRSEPGRINRSKEEEVVWQRLVLQITKGIAMERAGAKPELGEVKGFYPCSLEKEIAYMALRRASDSLWKRY